MFDAQMLVLKVLELFGAFMFAIRVCLQLDLIALTQTGET